MGDLLAPLLTDLDAPLMVLMFTFEQVLGLASEKQLSEEDVEASRALYRLEREVSARRVGSAI